MIGQWKNFEELEENLSLPEAEAILDARRREKWDQQKFAAALKGVEVDDYDTAHGVAVKSGDDVRREAMAELRGMSEEQIAFEELGIMIIDEQEDEGKY